MRNQESGYCDYALRMIMSSLRISEGERENIIDMVDAVAMYSLCWKGEGTRNTHRDGVASPSLPTYRHRGAWRGDTRNW